MYLAGIVCGLIRGVACLLQRQQLVHIVLIFLYALGNVRAVVSSRTRRPPSARPGHPLIEWAARTELPTVPTTTPRAELRSPRTTLPAPGRSGRGPRGAWCGAYGWYFSSTVSAPPDLGFMVTRTVTLPVFAAVSSWSTVHFEVP